MTDGERVERVKIIGHVKSRTKAVESQLWAVESLLEHWGTTDEMLMWIEKVEALFNELKPIMKNLNENVLDRPMV